jgi:dihydroneopterin aldolase
MEQVVTHFFRNYAIRARIGVHEHEKAAPQRILIDVDYDYRRPEGPEDKITSVLDYDGVREEIETIVRSRHFNLQETLCDMIMESLMARPEVVRVRVSTRKPNIYPDVEAVGIIIEQRKS